MRERERDGSLRRRENWPTKGENERERERERERNGSQPKRREKEQTWIHEEVEEEVDWAVSDFGAQQVSLPVELYLLLQHHLHRAL